MVGGHDDMPLPRFLRKWLYFIKRLHFAWTYIFVRNGPSFWDAPPLLNNSSVRHWLRDKLSFWWPFPRPIPHGVGVECDALDPRGHSGRRAVLPRVLVVRGCVLRGFRRGLIVTPVHVDGVHGVPVGEGVLVLYCRATAGWKNQFTRLD